MANITPSASHNVIMADRKKLKSANGMYLGSTGSGKSFAAKRKLINVFLATSDRIVIVDPMGEYSPLVRRLGGQVIEIAPDSPHHINPMDIEIGLNDEDSPLSMKADFLLSLCELVVGGKDGLQPIEKTVIDRCVLIYRNRHQNGYILILSAPVPPQILFPSLKLGNNTFDLSRFARRCKQRQPQNMANITSDLSVRK